MAESGTSAGSVWTVQRRGPVAIATLHFPPRNFMTFAGMTELEGIVEGIADDPTVTVLVLASDLDGYFVAHGDLPDLIKLGSGQPFEGDAMSWPRTLGLFVSMPQIVVAAINGQAWGGGLEMSLAATLRVAGPRAHFALCEVGLGLIPGGGGTQRLPRLIGAGNAAKLILSGLPIDAAEALRIGLVQAVLGDDTGETFLDAVLEWVQPIATRPASSLTAAKRAMLDGLALPLEEGLALEGSLVGPLLAQPASIELQENAIRRYAETDPAEVVVL